MTHLLDAETRPWVCTIAEVVEALDTSPGALDGPVVQRYARPHARSAASRRRLGRSRQPDRAVDPTGRIASTASPAGIQPSGRLTTPSIAAGV